MKKPYLSAVIIAYNESHNIERCLKSLQAIADEILVVDSGSTDDTVFKSEALGARVLHHAFAGHIEQKNWATDQAHGRWIISLDADESLSTELASSLQAWKAKTPVHSGYRVNRLTSYCGHWVRHGGWYPDQKLRLWQKGAACWSGENPHDRLELNEVKSSGHLKGDLLHHSYNSVDDHVRQIDYFSDIAAAHYTGPFWLTSPWIRPFKRAFQWSKNALLRGGWRDGWAGWTIAKYSALATTKKYEKARCYRRSKRLLKASGKSKVQRLLVCRTDAIGDAVLTLPIASWIKSSSPDLQVDFLVRSYAAPIVSAATDVDNVVIWDTDTPPDLSGYDAAILAFPDLEVVRFIRNQGVAIVLGTSRRWPFRRWITHKNRTSRKVSGEHEAWHCLELAKSMHPSPGWESPGLQLPFSSKEMKHLGRLRPKAWSAESASIIGASQWVIEGRKNFIVHPGSAGSANNWTVGHYLELTERLSAMGHRVLWTGTALESQQLGLDNHTFPSDVIDVMGKMNLDQLLALIGASDGLIASSTGPLHMAAASDIMCLGLYGPNAPEWPQRWHPLGSKAHWITAKRLSDEGALDIQVDEVVSSIQRALKA
jgi:ADP-heptose:LPS heptosyltransferase